MKDHFDCITSDLFEPVPVCTKKPRACAAAPGACEAGAAQARSAEASYVPVTRKVSLTDEKKHALGIYGENDFTFRKGKA